MVAQALWSLLRTAIKGSLLAVIAASLPIRFRINSMWLVLGGLIRLSDRLLS